MQLLYPVYYKSFGIRRIQQLLSPKLIILNSLPRDVMVHYISEGEDDPKDLDVSLSYFNQNNRRVLVDYADKLLDPKGTYRKIEKNIRSLVKDFHASYRRFKYVNDHFKSVKDPLTLLVMNYNYLDDLYKYPDMPMSGYYKWLNKHITLWDTVAEVAQEQSRNHFVFVDTPKELPSYNLLNMFSDKSNVAMLKIFDTEEKLFLLELWKWLNPETRLTSAMAAITANNASKVNIVFNLADGRSMLINLGYLNSWIKDEINTTEFATVNQFKPVQIQKIFLKSLMIIGSVIPEEAADVPEQMEETVTTQPDLDVQETMDELSETDEVYADGSQSDFNLSAFTNGDSSLKSLHSKLANKDDDGDIPVEGDIELEAALKNIDEELKSLDKINNLQLKEKGIVLSEKDSDILPDLNDVPVETIRSLVYEDRSTEEILLSKADEFAESGYLSAADYRKFTKDISAYLESKDPYGSDQLTVDRMVVKESDIKLDANVTNFVDRDIVIDKRMLQSSLKDFDRGYVRNVKDKHMLAMLDGIQRAGVVIKRHEVEIDTSALGSYEYHTLELKPIDGASSTIRFRLPRVDENGTFEANSNKYVLRKQRVD